MKPSVSGLWSGISEHGVKYNHGHVSKGAVVLPTWSVVASVQVVGRARAGVAQVVQVERQRRVRWRIVDIGISVGAKGTRHGRHQDGKTEE